MTQSVLEFTLNCFAMMPPCGVDLRNWWDKEFAPNHTNSFLFLLHCRNFSFPWICLKEYDTCVLQNRNPAVCIPIRELVHGNNAVFKEWDAHEWSSHDKWLVIEQCEEVLPLFTSNNWVWIGVCIHYNLHLLKIWWQNYILRFHE